MPKYNMSTPLWKCKPYKHVIKEAKCTQPRIIPEKGGTYTNKKMKQKKFTLSGNMDRIKETRNAKII